MNRIFDCGQDRRVVITGMGVVSAIGMTLDALWDTCCHGISGVRPFSYPNSEPVSIRFAAPADCFTGDAADFGELDGTLKKDIRKSLKLMSREIQMGVASAERAIQDAGIAHGELPPERVGVSFASEYIMTPPDEILDGVNACTENGRFDFSRWAENGKTKMTPIWQLKFLTNMPTSHISILNMFHGVGNAITNREASIGAVVGEAVEIIRSGKVDVMVVGATGSRLQPTNLIISLLNDPLADVELTPETASRPFDRDRTGSVLGEGAGALILESAEHAQKRGAKIYAEALGGSYRAVLEYDRSANRRGFFKSHRTENLLESYRLTLKSLFEKTGVSPECVGHINAHGVGEPTTDAAEATAIRAFFGDLADRIPVTGLKGHLGNPGAGGGAIELIASILAMQNGALFPIKNNENDDPTCPIRPVRSFGEEPGDLFLKLASQAYGQTSAVLVRKFDA